VKGYEATTWFGLLAPAKTPRDVVSRLNAEVDRILKSPDLKERFLNDGLDAMGGPPEAFAKFIQAEIDKYAKVIRTAEVPQQ
jgi:tripartite-type tricarboxylate transporter receptor subunit TctC